MICVVALPRDELGQNAHIEVIAEACLLTQTKFATYSSKSKLPVLKTFTGLSLEPSSSQNETMTCEEAPQEKSMTPIPEEESEIIHQIKAKFLGDMDL